MKATRRVRAEMAVRVEKRLRKKRHEFHRLDGKFPGGKGF
jgi:hypothetical protein